VRLDEPAARAAVALDRGAAALVGEVDARPVREPLDGLHERQVLDLHHEGDHVAAVAAAEAVERAVRRAHVERRRLLVVEGAQPLERAPARPLQRNLVTDDLVDPAALTHQCDVAFPDASCHVAESNPLANCQP
jgi:hypothetical protein